MQEVTRVFREKRTYRMSLDELRKGDWCMKLIPADKAIVDLEYKSGYLTVSLLDVKQLEKRDNNGRQPNNTGTKTE
jgi:hypothetical protein